MIKEKCTCGGDIFSSILPVFPPIYKKSCNNCEKVWRKRTKVKEVIFNPDTEGYQEMYSGKINPPEDWPEPKE